MDYFKNKISLNCPNINANYSTDFGRFISENADEVDDEIKILSAFGIFDKENNWWIMDDETILIYMFCRSIFDKNDFKPSYITEIEKRKVLLRNKNVKNKLSKVFFKYTDFLISQVENSNYENIIENYITFKNY